MADQTVVVRGYREFLHACDRAGKDTKKFVRGTYREVGNIVKVEGARRVLVEGQKNDERTAAGFRTYVRARGVSVEQSLRKTTGKHPEYGAWQMRHGLVPALEAKADVVEREFVRAMDKVADRFGD